MPARNRTVIDPNNPPDDDDNDDLTSSLGDLAALADADQDWNWQVHRKKHPDELAKNPRGQPRVWTTRIHGPVDLEDFHRRFGGGTYEFWGSHGGQLRTRVTIELPGEPRIQTPPPPATNPPGAEAPHNDVERERIRWMRRLVRERRRSNRRLERLLLNRPAEPQREGLGELVKTLVALDSLRRTGQPANTSDGELLDRALAMLQQGIQIGQTREPTTTPEGTDWVRVAEIVVPVIQDAFTMRARRAAAARPAPSHAEVVDPPPPPPPAGEPERKPEAQAATHRWLTAVETLATAVTEADDPEDTVATLERILDTQELGRLKMAARMGDAGVTVVVGYLEPYFEQIPVLNTPQARDYIAAVLQALIPEAEPAE